ncbi:MAG TPA: GNAT family N-acetyltransferase [Azoarcus taiwanensis]|uniref:GNAT family N-acetyltransferase n=1 Tax=Azoarcus taiwanensis TaxID=666964 RepID=A0A972F6G2_9RHOO|nr:GNAT family N-acetyltransferase [Azoarcus taiwanensis]NMG01820.1 GNAT family N-acetyltransferase [Azoarcus taiwanensis]HRQ56535.1 GNAT family N-acetyltransferase [Azoarcus taiwanensis]
MSTDSAEWQRFQFYLTFRFGEIGLAERQLPVMRKVHSMAEIANGVTVSLPTELPDDCAGLYLARLPESGLSQVLANSKGLIAYPTKHYLHSYIDMSGDFEGYATQFSSKTRSTIRRKIKKFAEHTGGLDFREFRRPEEMPQFHREARAVSALTYQERLLDAGLPDSPSFVERLHRRAAHDQIRGYLLYDRGRPVSYLYCPIKDGSVKYAFLGYDPEYGKLSPGTVLQWLALEQLFAEKCYRFFDFTEGEGDHKLLFSTHQANCVNLLLLKPTAQIRISLQAHRSLNAFSSSAASFLDRMGLKKGLKKLIRRNAA